MILGWFFLLLTNHAFIVKTVLVPIQAVTATGYSFAFAFSDKCMYFILVGSEWNWDCDFQQRRRLCRPEHCSAPWKWIGCSWYFSTQQTPPSRWRGCDGTSEGGMVPLSWQKNTHFRCVFLQLIPPHMCMYICSMSLCLCSMYLEESDRLADLLVKIVEDNSKGCYFSVDPSSSVLDPQNLAAQFKDANELLKQAFLKAKSWPPVCHPMPTAPRSKCPGLDLVEWMCNIWAMKKIASTNSFSTISLVHASRHVCFWCLLRSCVIIVVICM